MAGPNDFTGLNIQDTYQRVLQISSSGQITDGTGSLIQLLEVTASYAVSASHEITNEISSSYAQSASVAEKTQGALTIGTGLDLSNSAVNFDGDNDRTLTLDLTEVIHDDGANKLLTTDGDGTLTAETQFTINDTDATLNGDLIVTSSIQTPILRGDSSFATGLLINGYLQTLGTSGHVTASGNISSSGTITANKIEADSLISRTGDANTGLQMGSDTVQIEGNDTVLANFNTSYIDFPSGLHITASGDISASGYGHFANLQVPAGGYLRFDDVIGSDDQYILGNENNITVDGDQFVKLIANDSIEVGIASNDIKLTIDTSEGHITASGNISASGEVLSTGFKSHDNYAAIWNGSTMVFGTYQQPAAIRSSQLELNQGNLTLTHATNGHITASGNMSASGAVTASGLMLPQLGTIEWSSAAGERQLIKGTDNYINIDGDNFVNVIADQGIHLDAHVTASGNISASGTVTADDLYLPSTSPSTTSNLLYVSSSTDITGSRSTNNLMYSGSMIGTGTGIIHIMHGSYKKSADHQTRTYISFGTGDKENTQVGNGYVRYHPPYGGKIRKFTAAGSLGGNKIGVVTFELYLNGSIVSAATCTATVNPQDTMVDIDFNGAAIFDKGDKIQIALTSAAADGTDYFIYWNSVFEFNVD